MWCDELVFKINKIAQINLPALVDLDTAFAFTLASLPALPPAYVNK